MSIKFKKKKFYERKNIFPQVQKAEKIQKSKEFLVLLLLGFIFSLFIHLFIFKNLNKLEISLFKPAFFDPIVARRFHLERVEIDPKLLEEPKKTNPASKPTEVILSEKNNFSNQQESSPDYSKKRPNSLNSLEISEEKPEIIKNLVPDNFQKPNQPLVSFVFDEAATKEDGFMEKFSNKKQTGALDNYSQLDQLIEEKKPLNSETAPILLPTDLLFEYDADQLKPEAEKSLEKLATLIQRNPKAQFTIEGFTDSFGGDDYNLDLSARRAESIKKWLIEKQAINENQIKARGLGKSHFIVPSTGSIQEQQLNRRVEIVIQVSSP
ncbi:MAG: OmpA family protein [Chthoniobacterales bacterium]